MFSVKISIVVPAFNEQKLIGSSLQAINKASAAFERLKWESELIVCDNNSSDRTAELARAEGATVVFEPINQIGRARNRGAAEATGDWIIFIDADSSPSQELFAAVARVIQSGKCVAGGSTVKLERGHLIGNLITSTWNILSRIKKWAPGSFMFCERAAFEKIGGFSAELFVTEELDLFQRLKNLAREQGRQIVIVHRHPLLTSARKMHLYSAWDHLRLLGKTLIRTAKTIRNREECFMWYDGRR